MGKCLKPIHKTEKDNVNLATQVNHRYIASRSLTLLHFEVIKHSNYTPHFTNSTAKANPSFLYGMSIMQSPTCWES